MMSWKQANNTFFTNVDVKWCGSRSRSAFFWFSRSRSRNLKLSKMLIVINKSKNFLLKYIRLKTSILKNYESLWLATVQYQSKETLPWENYTYFAVWDVALGINNGPPTDFTEPCTFKMAHSLYKMLHIYCKSCVLIRQKCYFILNIKLSTFLNDKYGRNKNKWNKKNNVLSFWH